MKAYRLESDKRIDPFGDHPGDCLVTNRRLRDIQEETLQEAGLELVHVPEGSEVEDAEEHLVFGDSLLFTREAIDEFLARSREKRNCTVGAHKPGLVTRRSIVPTQDVSIHEDRVEYALHYYPVQEDRGFMVPVIIDPGNDTEVAPVPKHIYSGSEYAVPITDTFLLQVDHWVNLWQANLFMVLAAGARVKKAPMEYLMELVEKAGSTNRWDVACQLNKIGQDCDIHRTAYVENAAIGDNVTVGPGAVVRNSVIGKGAFIGHNAVVEACVLGERSSVINGGVVMVSVLGPESFTSAGLTISALLGRETFVAEGALLTDLRFDGRTIRVPKKNMMVDTGTPVIGVCVGHGSYMASGCLVAPGRTIPNGVYVAPDPSSVLRRVTLDEAIPGYQFIERAKGEPSTSV